jgi:hypothetical protein
LPISLAVAYNESIPYVLIGREVGLTAADAPGIAVPGVSFSRMRQMRILLYQVAEDALSIMNPRFYSS